MRVVGKSKKKMKVPIMVDNKTKELIAVGNLPYREDTDTSRKEDEIDNAIFEDEIMYYQTRYTGYSNHVKFLNRNGITYSVRNKGALQILKMLFFQEVKLLEDGYVRLKFSFTKSGHRYFIKPMKL